MTLRFDAVVVGAGPAGSAAALVLARAGRHVALVERGPFPGSKSSAGGVVHGRSLDQLVPDWRHAIPAQRWVVRRSAMVLSGDRSLTVDLRSVTSGIGCTTLRSDFDPWMAGLAVAAGAELITSTVVTGVRRDSGGVSGVDTDRPDGAIEAAVVVAADGVNSSVAGAGGLDAADHSLEAKEVLALPRREIDTRFGLIGDEGATVEVLGGAGPGFVHTNADTIAVGVRLHLPALAAARRRPEELIADLKGHPAIAPLVRGGSSVEYSAHLSAERGPDAPPGLVDDGLLVAGDATGMSTWPDGLDFAIGSGAAAGRAVDAALSLGDTSAAGLGDYRRRLDAVVLAHQHRRLRQARSVLGSDRSAGRIPDLLCDAVELLAAGEPLDRRGAVRRAWAGSGLSLRDVARGAWTRRDP